MFCPIPDKKNTSEDFQLLANAVGDNAAYAVYSMNNGNSLDKAPNGEPSTLFQQLLKKSGNDKIRALQRKATIFTNQFSTFSQGIELDKNGEPKLEDVLKYEEARRSSMPKTITKLYNSLIERLERRLGDVKYVEGDPRKVQEIRNLQYKLDHMDNDKAIMEFVPYMIEDIQKSLNIVNDYTSRVETARSYNTDHSVTAHMLDVLKKAYILFYKDLSINIENIMEDPDALAYINNPYVTDNIKQQLKYAQALYTDMVRKYDNLSGIIAKENVVKEASKYGSHTIEKLRQILDDGDVDLGWWDRNIANTQYVDNELVRLVLNKIVSAKNRVYDAEFEVGKKLLTKMEKVPKSKLKLLFETVKGKKTGFMVRDRNYGQAMQEEYDFYRKLSEEFGYPDIDFKEVPAKLTPEQQKQWNKRVNKYLSDHYEREFIPEYYDMVNTLSEETKLMRDQLNADINYILSPTVDEEGNPHEEQLDEESYNRLQTLRTQKRNMSNIYNLDGTIKIGIDREIAIEMMEYNKMLRDKVNYKPNMDKFKAAYEKAKKLPKEQFEKWLERYTTVRITDKFWEDLDNLSSSSAKNQNRLDYEEARRQLKRLYTDPNGNVDVDSIPDSVKEMITIYDQMIEEESYKDAQGRGKKSEITEIATWEVDPRFYTQERIAKAQGPSYYDNWLANNTRKGKKGTRIPSSFWTKLVPKEKLRSKYMERIPNNTWMEIDRESPWYNTPEFDSKGRLIKGFDKSRGEYKIPKKQLYDSLSEFEKITNDKDLLDLYNELLKVKKEADSYISMLRNENTHKLPQIEGGAYKLIRSKDNVLKGLAYAFEDSFTIKDDDDKYVRSAARRSDGSLVKLVPTRYLKMLSDPNTLTDDIVGSFISYYKMAYNFKEMSKLAPEMDNILDHVSKLQFTSKTRGELRVGESSNLYHRLQDTVDRLVYGIDSPGEEFKLGNRAISINKLVDSIARYTRIQGISQNINVILTGLVTNLALNRVEAFSGIYFDNKDYAAASKEISKAIASGMVNVGNANNKNKALLYLEKMGVVRDDATAFSDLHLNRFQRFLYQNYWYFGHSMVDISTIGKSIIAIGMHYKYVPSENKFLSKQEFYRKFSDKKKAKAEWNLLTTTFYDAFDTDGNKLVVKPQFKDVIDDKLMNRIRNTSKQLSTRVDSQLSELDKTRFHSTSFGKLLLIYRNFLIVLMQTKFMTDRQFNYSTQMWSEAQYKATWQYILRHWFNPDKIDQLKKEFNENYDSLDEYEQGQARRSLAELCAAMILTFIFTPFFKAMADDDDDWLTNESALITSRSALELRSNLIPFEAVNMFKNPTAAWNTMTYFGESIYSAFDFDSYSEQIKRGPYKGMTRFERSLIKVTPFRSIYEAKDPESKLQYYDNLISLF